MPTPRRALRFPSPARSAVHPGPHRRWTHPAPAVLVLVVLALLAVDARAGDPPPCDEDDGGLTLAEGLCGLRVGSDLGQVRHLAVTPSGDVFASVRGGPPGVLALRDVDGDGRADETRRFGPPEGHGLAWRDGHLWLATPRRVLRFALPDGALAPEGEPTVVVEGLAGGPEHRYKELALAPDGALYVTIGAPSNACQERKRTPRSPGQDPCPQLKRHAGVWRFEPGATGQQQADGRRVATGLRHTLGLDLHPDTGELFGVMNGRDMLAGLWGWSAERNARLPGEELVHIRPGDDFGWPYCYWDPKQGEKVLAPEYGGDGEKVGRCGEAKAPALGFPAHWAPMEILFVEGDAALPEAWGPGALVAFRGSWNRAPLPQEGYRVVYVPFSEGRPAGGFSLYAIGRESPTAVRFTGLARGPDGSIFLAADANGSIWRVRRSGD